ncbi:hypothetical protein THAOC_33411 [Thalassiosira oceanica]|uniref:Sulfotransferase domain-containing protein n=1 Tax=Thalassiosira oceanica TaxID=159749 RepID=K0RM92_THAOC|nr:hypothetical protein THAOC_33411 [Thalassiosira oceanica]|eukprot:EJK47847.1 hypothetical protein THAOC_33411 [Thalassiosira oceanica]
MHRRRNRTGEAGRGSAPPDPPGALAKDTEDSRRKRIRWCCWQSRRVLTAPEAVCLLLLHVTLALALILAMSNASLITWTGIRDLRSSVGEGGVDPVSKIEDHFVRNTTSVVAIERTGSGAVGAVKAEAATEEETVDTAATNIKMSASGSNALTASRDTTFASGANDSTGTGLEFVHIPKTGGSSVEFAGAKAGIAWGVCQYDVKMRGCDPLSTEFNHLAPMRDRSEWECEISTAEWHCPPARYKSGKNPFDGRKTFTVVRSPYDIVLSEYRWAHKMLKSYQSVTREQLSSVDYMNHWVQDNIKYAIANGSAEGGGHLIPQHVYTHDAKGRLLVDHLLRQEHLTEEFSQLMNQYNLPANLSHYNVHTTETLGVDDFTDETVKLINEWAELDFRNKTPPEASTDRNSKQEIEGRGSRSHANPLLIADFKWKEGVNAQLYTLGAFLAVANATGRELLLVPFRSEHYVDSTGKVQHLLRMEDYIINSPGAWPGWRTADPHDGSAPEIVRSLLNPNETVDEAERYKGCVHGRAIVSRRPWKVAYTPFEDVVKAITALPDEVAACVAGRPRSPAGTPGADFFEPNTLPRKLSERGIAAIRAGAALGPDAKLSAVHLRRGNRCGRDLDAVGKVRCGPAAGLPFMSLCAELRGKGGGLYVATDEEDRSFLDALRDGGCFVRQDLGIDFVAEAEAANDEMGGSWRSVHPKALEFVTEKIILRHAEEFYTMDHISSTLRSIGKYREHHGLSEPRVFGDGALRWAQ